MVVSSLLMVLSLASDRPVSVPVFVNEEDVLTIAAASP